MKAFIFVLFVATAASAPLPDNSGPIDVVVNGLPEGTPLEISHLLGVNVKEKVNGDVVSAVNVLHPYSAQGLAEAAAIAEEASAAKPESPTPIQNEALTPIELPKPVKPEVVPSEEVTVLEPVVPSEIEVLTPVELPDPVKPEVVPSPIELPVPAQPEVVPSPIELPAPAKPEVVPSPIELPAPAQPEVVPSPIELPAPAQPEVVPSPVEIPVPVQPEVIPEVVQPVDGPVYNDGLVEVHTNIPDPTLMNTISSWFNMVVNYVTGSETTQTAHIA